MVAGDLKNALVLITRNGKAGDMQTTYSVDVLPAAHPVFKPEMIPADFSAFNNFNIAKHSYWEKSAEEINTFLTTGQFPERQAANTQQAVNNVAAVAGAYAALATATPTYTAPVQPATPAYVAPAAPVQSTAPTYVPGVTTAPATVPVTTAAPAATPVRNFSGFSF
jgi:hypothetical protein